MSGTPVAGTSPWRQWLNSPPGDQMLFLRAAMLLALTRCALRTVGFASIRSTIGASPPCGAGERREDGRSAARAMERASRHVPFRTTCLDRAVALCWLLRADDLPASLRIGVKREEEGLAAHAWVERLGERLLDDGDGAFESFDTSLLDGTP